VQVSVSPASVDIPRPSFPLTIPLSLLCCLSANTFLDERLGAVAHQLRCRGRAEMRTHTWWGETRQQLCTYLPIYLQALGQSWEAEGLDGR
jgi:hypothetical protein